MSVVRITPRARGPLVVEGSIELFDLDGHRIDLAGRTKVALCRCGQSSTRPLCDGSHNRVAFEAPPPQHDAEPESCDD